MISGDYDDPGTVSGVCRREVLDFGCSDLSLQPVVTLHEEVAELAGTHLAAVLGEIRRQLEFFEERKTGECFVAASTYEHTAYYVPKILDMFEGSSFDAECPRLCRLVDRGPVDDVDQGAVRFREFVNG